MCVKDNLCFYKFVSNSKDVLEVLLVSDCVKDFKDLDFWCDIMFV